MIRRAVVQVSLLAAFGSFAVLSAPGGALAQRDAPPLRRLTFRSEFTGVSADGQNCVWEGSVDGAARGILKVELRQVEGPFAAASPVWHLVSRWAVADPAGAHSFAAELEGMVDWRTGVTRLSGLITSGWMQGAWVQAEGRFINGDPSGSLAISPK